MPFLTPDAPPYDPAEFLTHPRQERLRLPAPARTGWPAISPRSGAARPPPYLSCCQATQIAHSTMGSRSDPVQERHAIRADLAPDFRRVGRAGVSGSDRADLRGEWQLKPTHLNGAGRWVGHAEAVAIDGGLRER